MMKEVRMVSSLFQQRPASNFSITMVVWLQSPSGTYRSVADLSQQFVASQTAMQELQEILRLEQTLFVSLLGSMWRRVSPSSPTSSCINLDPLPASCMLPVDCPTSSLQQQEIRTPSPFPVHIPLCLLLPCDSHQ